jgi:TM2 domain-containing membrane protein YozV
MKIFLFIPAILASIVNAAGADSPLDSVNPVAAIQDSLRTDSADTFALALPPPELTVDPLLAGPVRYNPVTAVCLSTIMPGIGQMYCRRRVKGALFLGVEIIWTFYSIDRINRFKYTLQKPVDDFSLLINEHLDSLSKYTPDLQVYQKHYDNYIDAHMGYDLARYRRRTGRYDAYHGIGWMAGLYLWNIWDALDCSNTFVNNTPRNPAVAAWLSAIPFLGLGQIYNGSFSKAGLIWTIHTLLAYMSYNYNRLLNDCITKRHQVESAQSVSTETNPLYNTDIKSWYISRWDEEHDIAFRKRNTYLWYFVLFYFYGVFDAAVDAHLHDYEKKIRLRPELDTKNESVSLKMDVDF